MSKRQRIQFDLSEALPPPPKRARTKIADKKQTRSRTAAVSGLSVAQQRELLRRVREMYRMQTPVTPFALSDPLPIGNFTVQSFCLRYTLGQLRKRQTKTVNNFKKTHPNVPLDPHIETTYTEKTPSDETPACLF